MMRTAILVTLAVLTVSVLAVPAQADPIASGCETNEKVVDYKVCYRVDPECTYVSFTSETLARGYVFAC